MHSLMPQTAGGPAGDAPKLNSDGSSTGAILRPDARRLSAR
jgi:hypothetical protein